MMDDATVLKSDPGSLVHEQHQDALLSKLRMVMQGTKLPDDSIDQRLLDDLAETTELEANGLLVQHRGNKKVPWLPDQLRQLVLKMVHDRPTGAHAGFFKTLKRVSERFVWLGMRADLSKYVRC